MTTEIIRTQKSRIDHATGWIIRCQDAEPVDTGDWIELTRPVDPDGVAVRGTEDPLALSGGNVRCRALSGDLALRTNHSPLDAGKQ